MFSSLFDLLGFHTVWKGDGYCERGELLSRPGRGVPKNLCPPLPLVASCMPRLSVSAATEGARILGLNVLS